jgi:hypothetical protein
VVGGARQSPGFAVFTAELETTRAPHQKVDPVLPPAHPTNVLSNYKQALWLVRETHGHARAVAFGPLALKAVRQRMIDRGWTRKNINQ